MLALYESMVHKITRLILAYVERDLIPLACKRYAVVHPHYQFLDLTLAAPKDLLDYINNNTDKFINCLAEAVAIPRYASRRSILGV